MTERPRVLIEDWLPAAAIGVERITERSTGQQLPKNASTSGGRGAGRGPAPELREKRPALPGPLPRRP